jgi:hypothetical protein
LGVRAWSTEALGEFISATGREAEYRDAGLTAREAGKEFPGSVSWAVLHTRSMTLLTFVFVVVVGFGFFALYEVLSSR